MKNIPAILRSLALTVLAVVALCALAAYGTHDYQERAKERQAVRDEAQHYKTHPLVLNGCTNDEECKRLDAMLAVIHTSYTLD